MEKSERGRLEIILGEASPRPWLFSEKRLEVDTAQTGGDGELYDWFSWRPDANAEDIEDNREHFAADGRLICAAVNALPELLDCIHRLEHDRDFWRAAANTLLRSADREKVAEEIRAELAGRGR